MFGEHRDPVDNDIILYPLVYYRILALTERQVFA